MNKNSQNSFLKVIVYLLLGLSSCRVGIQLPPPKVYLPEHIKSIAVAPVVNKTKYNVYQELLTPKIIDEFIKDGRLTINPLEDADGILYTEITHYIHQPLTYTPTLLVEQCKLRVIADIYFVDKTTQKKLWEEPNIEEVYIFTDETLPGGITILEALETIYKNLAWKIVRRTIEGFGAISGTSIKKVPKVE